MKQKYLIVLLIISLFFIMCLLPNGLNIQVKAVESDIDFTFGSDRLIDTSVYDTSFNMRNQSEYSGNYNGTYSFENEIGLEGIYIDYVYSVFSPTINVIDNFNGHNSVLNFTTTEASRYRVNHLLGDIESGYIDLWLSSSTISSSGLIYYTNSTSLAGDNLAFGITFESNNLVAKYGDGLGGTSSVVLISAVNNEWYYLSIYFNCTTYKVSMWVNGILLVNDEPFMYDNEITGLVYTIYYGSDILNTNLKVDAIGYSWDDNYTIGDNLVPILETNESIQEVDRWEFCIDESTKEFREDDTLTTILGWDKIEQDFNIESDEHDEDDKQLRFYQGLGMISPEGLERDFNLNGTLLNITFSFEREDYGGSDDPNGWSVFNFYDNDSNLITRLNITYTTLEYWDGSNYIELYDGIDNLVYYEFNVYLNDGLAFLQFFIDGNLEDVYFLDLINNVIGLGNIDFRLYAPGVGKVIEVWIDYIGVYEKGLSISNDVGYLSVNNVAGTYLLYDLWYWSFAYYNLFDLDVEGNVSITYTRNYVGYTYNYYKPSFHVFTDNYLGLLFDWNLYNESTFHNIYNEYKTAYNSSINFLVIGDVILNNLSIAGIRAIANGESIPLVYGSNGVNLNNSYFFVEAGSNALRFSLTINDNELEYISLGIDLVALNILGEDRGISFRSDINGSIFGYVGVVYSDGTNTSLSVPTHETTTSAMLPISDTIFSLRILITDKDLDNDGFCTGYISNLRLIYYPTIKVFIIIDNLLVLIIPLMILLIPSLAMHKKFGVSGAVIMFILMSVVCVISALIPVWLFFIIGFGSIVFLFKKKGDN